jgi:hypothetical protein
MHLQPAPPAVLRGSSYPRHALPHRPASAVHLLAVESVGYLVPRTDLMGRIHSVFARACNIACHDTLLTLCAVGTGQGPTTLTLAHGAPDLRDLFQVGERVRYRDVCLRSGRVEVRLTDVPVWRPAGPGVLLPTARIQAHLSGVALALAQRPQQHTSVIDRQGAAAVSALRDACRALDLECATRRVERLVGWGEGLTPAGDDFLIGLLAGLDAFVQGEPRRVRFRGALASVIRGLTPRTTPIAAHYLRLAAGGHYIEPLLRLRRALLCEANADVVDAALRSALAVGATSGADTACGLSAGLRAWLPMAACIEAA